MTSTTKRVDYVRGNHDDLVQLEEMFMLFETKDQLKLEKLFTEGRKYLGSVEMQVTTRKKTNHPVIIHFLNDLLLITRNHTYKKTSFSLLSTIFLASATFREKVVDGFTHFIIYHRYDSADFPFAKFESVTFVSTSPENSAVSYISFQLFLEILMINSEFFTTTHKNFYRIETRNKL